MHSLSPSLDVRLLVVAALFFTACADGLTPDTPVREDGVQPDLDPGVLLDPEPLDALPEVLDTPRVLALDNTPVDNPTTAEGAALGRALFYDVRLSKSETVACASCHQQQHAFSDPAALSEGHEGGLTGRNSMSLVNVGFYAPGAMFWDERAATLEEQVLMPIQDSTEMGMTLPEVEAVIGADPAYETLFSAAFGDSEVTSDRVGSALAQFVRTLNSGDSPYDQGLLATGDPRQPFATLSAAENRGKALFFGRAGCAACHVAVGNPPPGAGGPPPQTAVFYLNGPANNGVDRGLPEDDLGVGGVTGDPADNGKMKSPSLRNVAVTGPYMHDGRFDTLEEVIDHYSDGVEAHPNLGVPLGVAGGVGPQVNMTDEEKEALVAFLRTLSDEEMVEDPRFSDPWVR